MDERKQFLETNGYEVSTANTDQDVLALLGTSHVDAVVFHPTDDSFLPKKIKSVNASVPIVLVTSTLDLPSSALDSIDALVANQDGPQFLLETLHFLLRVKPGQTRRGASRNTQSVRQGHTRDTASAGGSVRV